MTNGEHTELADMLHSIRGRAVVSGYRTALYDKLFTDWVRVDAPIKTCNSSKGQRQESLWLNFHPGENGGGEQTLPGC